MSKYPIPFGRHLLLERVNVGGMAEVFKAKSFGVAGFERIVAVKRILPTLAEDDEFITMFIDEARIAAHLTHQNIVQIYELGSHQNNFFISMEYVAGRDLRQILDDQKKLKRPMSTAKACFIVSQVCEALEYAHRKRDPAGKDLRIIHRDVTPQNVIISYEGEVKLCDFGIAKAASRASRTQVGVLKGKFAYMSPEQVRGQPTDRRSDLFALGVIFYEMLTGERLFLGESDYSTLEAVRNARVPAVRKLNPNVSRELEAIVMRLLTRDPKDRYQWASEAHEDLQDHLIDEGRLYHARHLRVWMQEAYARDIEVENAKLEAFMRLKLPEQPPEEALAPGPLLGVEESKAAAPPPDPANFSQTYAPHEDPSTTGETGDFEAPDDAKHNLPTRPIDYEEEVETDGGRGLGDGPVPTIGSSPVSSLFGTPELSGEEQKSDPEIGDNDPVVIVPDGESSAKQAVQAVPLLGEIDEETASDEVERTLFDMPVLPELQDNETLFDQQETVGGDTRIQDEIDEAQAALLDRLDEVGALSEDNDTIDASEHSNELAPLPPTVQDPSERSADLDGDEMDDETSISPMALEDIEDESFGPTMIRPQGDEVLQEDTSEDFNAFDQDEGTVEESPAGMIGSSPPPEVQEEARASEGGRSQPGRRIVEVKEPSSPRAEAVSAARAAGTDGARPFSPGNVVEPTGLAKLTRDPVVLMLTAAAIGLLSVSVLAFTLLEGSDDETTASIQILTEPTRQVEVKLDGELVGTETPVDIPGLELGVHTVELSSPGFRTYTQRIQIAQAKPHTMVVPLEALPESQVAKAPPPVAEKDDPPPVKDPPPGGEEPLPKKDDPLQVEPPPPEKVASPPKVEPPQPPPVKAAPPPPPRKVAPPPSPRRVSPRRAPPRPKKRPEGFLMVSTRPPGVSVMIDGKPTGLRTPIRRPHALPPGKHSITFLMDDGRKYDFSVRITAGQTTKMVKMLR